MLAKMYIKLKSTEWNYKIVRARLTIQALLKTLKSEGNCSVCVAPYCGAFWCIYVREVELSGSGLGVSGRRFQRSEYIRGDKVQML